MKDLNDVSILLDAVALACHLEPCTLREAIENHAIKSVANKGPSNVDLELCILTALLRRYPTAEEVVSYINQNIKDGLLH